MTTLITQKNYNDCVLASMAMALGKATWEEAWTPEDLEAVTESKGIADYEPWFARHGLKPFEDYKEVHVSGTNIGTVRALLWGRRAILSVNSLNHDGGSHAVYWDGEKVFDPNEGFPGKIAYKFLSSMSITRVCIFK